MFKVLIVLFNLEFRLYVERGFARIYGSVFCVVCDFVFGLRVVDCGFYFLLLLWSFLFWLLISTIPMKKKVFVFVNGYFIFYFWFWSVVWLEEILVFVSGMAEMCVLSFGL